MIDWARSAGHQDLVEYFATSNTLHIFDAITVNRLDLIRQIILKDPTQLQLTFGDTRSERTEPWDVDWKTPLASAITRENIEAVELLLELGAPLDPTPEGISLADYAKENSKQEIHSLIQSRLT